MTPSSQRSDRDNLQRDGLCTSAELDELHRDFSAPLLSEIAGARGQAVRIIFINGHDMPVVVVDAVRRRGEGARVTVRGLGDPGRRSESVMQGELDAWAWAAVASGAREQTGAMAVALPPPRVNEDGEGIVCLHGWTTIIETYGFGAARTLIRNACGGSNATHDYAWSVGRLAFAALRDCAWIDPEFHRNIMQRLSWCLGFSGRVNIAASAESVAHRFYEENFTSERVRFLLANDFTLTLPGETPVTGSAAALERWRAFVAAGDYETGFDGATGSEGDDYMQTAQLRLLLFDDTRADWQHSSRFAEVTQTWRQGEDRHWFLTSMEVGPFQVFRFPD